MQKKLIKWNFFKEKFIPYKLVEGANSFTLENYYYTIAFSIMCSILFIIATILKMNKVEII